MCTTHTDETPWRRRVARLYGVTQYTAGATPGIAPGRATHVHTTTQAGAVRCVALRTSAATRRGAATRHGSNEPH
jgi:hypothetical protein